jgi:hypothetical protein
VEQTHTASGGAGLADRKRFRKCLSGKKRSAISPRKKRNDSRFLSLTAFIWMPATNAAPTYEFPTNYNFSSILFATGEMGFRVQLHGSSSEPPMSALRRKRTFTHLQPRSALPPKAEIG